MFEINVITDVEKFLNDIKAVIFDLDDTLYSEKDYVRSGYKAVAKEYPHIKNMESKLWDAFQHGGQAIDEVLIAEDIFSEENKARCLKIYRYHEPDISLYSGVIDMIIRIKKSGLRTGIITDGRPEGQHAKIISLGLEELIDEIIITDELGGITYRKPNNIAFHIMHQKMSVSFNKMLY